MYLLKVLVLILSTIEICVGLKTENLIQRTLTNSPLVAPHLIEASRQLNQIKDDPDSACMLCQQVISGIISLRRSNSTKDVMMDYLNQLCVLYTDWGEDGCKGRTDIETDTILFIIDNKKDLQPARFCSIYFQSYNCEDPNADNWSIPLPDYAANVASKYVYQNDTDSVQILQITDVHLDPLYSPGSNAKCSEPLCCDSGVPANPEDAAGYWGDYKVCDMPWHTMENMMERIREKHKHIDWIYFTGDIVSHRSWATSVQSNTESIKLMFTLLEKTFPNKTVFPILGNHEAHPADFYSPDTVDKTSNVSTQWLLDLAADEWSRWLPNATQSTIRKGGYYTVLVKPGFRIVALNSNVCFISNLWLIYENLDTFGQLQWLVNVLSQAEKNGEKVHILSHVPSSDDINSCVKIWSKEFRKIVLRFSDTIVAQFNGHTHMDEFKLYFNASDMTEVKNVAYNGASFATFVGSNPDYRIYEVDNNNMSVTDYSQYTFNLTQANSNAKSYPEWYKLYSFKETYGLPDLTHKSLEKLYWQMTMNNSDNALVDTYFKLMYRNSDVYNKAGCDRKCKKKLVCLIAAVETTESVYC
ncbi:unnamed protein product [Ceutorhynchus assimilis]|uniref:Sphingomyelin phosphodiesterase n=1 Tax=Ceutorhynchus assimilis TaxID=467358 RepID=A0A9N9MM62_9CUCU|nr:unnamed protein product [Ceutorhynchus assimilis]